MKKIILTTGLISVWLGGCATTTPASTDSEITTSTEASMTATTDMVPEPKAVNTQNTVALPAIKPNEITKVATLDYPTQIKPFEPLVYGQEKELVCTTPILANGKLKDRPNVQVMWENYLYDRPEGIWGEIGGLVEVNGNLPFDQGQWTNACAVRLSHMLNKAGHKIPREGGNKTVSGGNKDQYYYRLADFEAYLISRYGKPDINISDGTANSFDLPITPGIVLMDFPDNSFTGHVTIWNGAGTVDGAEIGGYRVLFWDLPCFTPVDRISVDNQGTGELQESASP